MEKKLNNIEILGIIKRKYPFSFNEIILIFFNDKNNEEKVIFVTKNTKKLSIDFFEGLNNIEENFFDYKPKEKLYVDKKKFIKNIKNIKKGKCRLLNYNKDNNSIEINKEKLTKIN